MGALKFTFSQMVALRNFLDLGLFASSVHPKSFSSGMEREKFIGFYSTLSRKRVFGRCLEMEERDLA